MKATPPPHPSSSSGAARCTWRAAGRAAARRARRAARRARSPARSSSPTATPRPRGSRAPCQVARRVVVGAVSVTSVVVDARGRDRERAVARAAAEQVDRAARRRHRDRELPRLRAPDRLDDEVGAAAAGFSSTRSTSGGPRSATTVSAAPNRSSGREPFGVRVEHDRPGAGRGEQRALHQAERAAPRTVACLRPRRRRARARRSRAAPRARPRGGRARRARRCRFCCTTRCGTSTCSANPPSRYSRSSHRLSRPRAQAPQSPHGAELPQNTRSPSASHSRPRGRRRHTSRELVAQPRRVRRDQRVAAPGRLHVGAAAQRRADSPAPPRRGPPPGPGRPRPAGRPGACRTAALMPCS